jgi:hypothetical protein
MSADFLAPDVIKKVFVELKDLTQNPPEGIKVVINEEDVTDVQALIDGPGNGSSQITFKLRIQNYFIFYESSLLIALNRGYTLRRWCLQNETEARLRISASSSQGLLFNQDLPSERLRQG